MQQRDYLLREIEKIGMMLRAIRQKLIGGSDDLKITSRDRIEVAKEMLFNEMNFDLDNFLTLNQEESVEKIKSVEGLSEENLDYLAECIAHIGFMDESGKSETILHKALYLYDYSSKESRTFSFDREQKIAEIKNRLNMT
jgi:hypothetical protein